jgi:hypothetical protein
MKSERTFKVWEYQVSHGQLLIRSPKSPATGGEPERVTNLDVICVGVKYMAVPRAMKGLELADATDEELSGLASVLGRPVKADEVSVLISQGHRHVVVASRISVAENDWDIFESPFEFRSQYRRRE